MRRLLLASTLLTSALGVIGGTPTPAHATLQIAAQIGPDSFFCADNTGCDSSPTAGVITTSNVTLDGIVFSPSSAAVLAGPLDFLNAANLLITNTTNAAVNITITTGDNGFTAPVGGFDTAGSGVWQGLGGSFASLNWFVDPANAQGASNAFDTPGTLIDNTFSTSAAPVLGFSSTRSIADPQSDLFSLTVQTTIHLGPGESLVNRGQDIVSAAVPEPSTWAMLLIGFGFMAWGVSTRKRLRALY